MLRTAGFIALSLAGGAAAFSAPSTLPTSLRPAARTCNVVMQHSGKPIDRVDGFGGGYEAVYQTIEKRSKDDWGGGKGTGGASGKMPTGPSSFEEVKDRSICHHN